MEGVPPDIAQHFFEKTVVEGNNSMQHLSDLCFDNCVKPGWYGFQSKSLELHETKCIKTCAEKYLKYVYRCQTRYTEITAQQKQALEQQAAQK
jgi:hypothetical protein